MFQTSHCSGSSNTPSLATRSHDPSHMTSTLDFINQ